MTGSEALPSAGALIEVRRLAGPSAVVVKVARLEGGQHADTWRVDTDDPPLSVVVRQFPIGDPGARHEQRALRVLAGLGGLAPVLLAGDLDGRWSQHPTTLLSRLDGEADITPRDPQAWARELGCALALVHAVPGERLARLPSVLDRRGSPGELDGPLAARVRSRWAQISRSPEVLTHSDYWSGNTVWRDGTLSGIVDWSGAARGPRGYDVGWCRLDLVRLLDEHIASVFLAAYEAATGEALPDVELWDEWAAARSHSTVETWAANYAPLGRSDLDQRALRERHSRWSARLLEGPDRSA
jgi:aminoglycoside phosphotransferase (APT) family kinase protein